MTTYHISPTTGRPNICRAKKNACPIGDEHYASPEAAREAYEAQNTAVPAGKKKTSPAESYDAYDRPLKGTGTGPGGREATLQRLESSPNFEIEHGDTDHAHSVSVNGEQVLATDHWSEVEVLHRAASAGQWTKVRELLYYDQSVAGEIDDHLVYSVGDLDEELEALEEDLATRPQPKGKAYDTHLQTVECARVALAIRNYERKVEATELDIASLSTTKIHEPGVSRYEEVATKDGAKLGTVTSREGFFIAAVHNGRAPFNIGQYNSRDEALIALAKNKGQNQAQ